MSDSEKLSTGAIIGITIGIAVAIVSIALIIWLFTKKKTVKKAGKQGKKYKKSSELEYLTCIIQPQNWVSKSSCTKPVKSNPSSLAALSVPSSGSTTGPTTSTSKVSSIAPPRQVVHNGNIRQILV